MELATQIKALVAASDTPQKVLAATWAERWNVGRADRQALELSTVESRLSELINGKSPGRGSSSGTGRARSCCSTC